MVVYGLEAQDEMSTSIELYMIQEILKSFGTLSGTLAACDIIPLEFSRSDHTAVIPKASQYHPCASHGWATSTTMASSFLSDGSN